MPQTKKQKILFSLLMSAFMVYGMEVYNKILLEGSFTVSHFFLQPMEFILLILAVILLETLIGGPLARKIAGSIVRPPAKPMAAIVAVQICTVCLMCPMMSLVAAIAFKCGLTAELLTVWLKTIAANFLMALLWQLLVAGPFARLLVLRLPERKKALALTQNKGI